VAGDRLGDHLAVVEGQDLAADVLALFMALARHHDHVARAGTRDRQIDGLRAVRL